MATIAIIPTPAAITWNIERPNNTSLSLSLSSSYCGSDLELKRDNTSSAFWVVGIGSSFVEGRSVASVVTACTLVLLEVVEGELEVVELYEGVSLSAEVVSSESSVVSEILPLETIVVSEVLETAEDKVLSPTSVVSDRVVPVVPGIFQKESARNTCCSCSSCCPSSA